MDEKVAVVGSLAANESVDVKSEMEGKVSKINFEEGERVKKGDELIILDREKLEASLDQAKSNFDIAQTTFTRMSTLVDQGAVSKQEFDQAKADVSGKKALVDLMNAELADTVITAPFDGVATSRQVSIGQVINKDKVLTQVINDDPLKVDFNVPEKYAGRLNIGQHIELVVAAYPNAVFNGEVYFVDPQVDTLTRTIFVKARVPNKDGKLIRGMFAKLDLVINTKDDALLIPETALIPKGDEVFVFSVDQDSKAAMKKVTTGIREPGMVEILSGLSSHDTVITEGYQKIGPGSLVKVSPPAEN